ncbi:MAG: TonB-dependent receptor plug domain-containing protein, partial [Elusimicrobiales bacterium]|nr:TonB-dependent receptor plug domain-containing protein [Elusimicrobiales bacterium]
MNKTILILFILIQNILSYGGDRPTEIYLLLSKNVSNSYESPIHKIPEIEVISNIENNKKISDIISISPSVIIKNNTSNYGLSLPSLRGFSSNQTVVVYDGVKLPKDITSTYDLSILPDNV